MEATTAAAHIIIHSKLAHEFTVVMKRKKKRFQRRIKHVSCINKIVDTNLGRKNDGLISGNETWLLYTHAGAIHKIFLTDAFAIYISRESYVRAARTNYTRQ